MKIITTPDPFLRHVAKPITIWDKKIEQEVKEMTALLLSAKDPEGVGLAATQCGLDRRLFLISDDGKLKIFVNPVITFSSTEMLSEKYKNPKKRFLEGCLSVPTLWGFVDRPLTVTMEYQTPKDGILTTLRESFSDQFSSYVQHEFDHLNGILFTDRILEQNGTVFKETKEGLVPLK